MNYKIKKFTQELNECESEFIERVRKFFQTYIRLDNYHLVNINWYESEKERTILNCIITYCIKDF